MRRSVLRSTAVALFMILALTAGTSSASAGDPLWIFAKCTEGSLISANNGGQQNVVVLGSAGFCGLKVLNSKFGVAVFQAGKKTTSVLSYNLRSYYPLGRRSFGMEVARNKSGTFGACLVGSPTMKVACVKIIFDHRSGYVEVRQISPTDTLVNARITGSEVAVDPRCAACF